MGRRESVTNQRSQTGNMKRDWLEFAQTLAEGARAKPAEDRRRLEAEQLQKASHQPRSVAPFARR